MEAIQQAFTVLLVLGLLGGTLYWLRSRGMTQFGGKGFSRGPQRLMRSVERLSLTPHHSLHLVSMGDRLLLIAVSPGGCSILDGSGREVPAEPGMSR